MRRQRPGGVACRRRAVGRAGAERHTARDGEEFGDRRRVCVHNRNFTQLSRLVTGLRSIHAECRSLLHGIRSIAVGVHGKLRRIPCKRGGNMHSMQIVESRKPLWTLQVKDLQRYADALARSHASSRAGFRQRQVRFRRVGKHPVLRCCVRTPPSLPPSPASIVRQVPDDPTGLGPFCIHSIFAKPAWTVARRIPSCASKSSNGNGNCYLTIAIGRRAARNTTSTGAMRTRPRIEKGPDKTSCVEFDAPADSGHVPSIGGFQWHR